MFTSQNMILTVILLCNVLQNAGGNMKFMTLIISVFLMAVNNDFDSYLSIRDFDSALESAGSSDSLRAEVFQDAGNSAMAAMLFEKALEDNPSAGLFAALWESIAISTEYYSSLSAPCFREQLQELSCFLSWKAGDLVSLIETSDAFGDSILTDSLVQILISNFPESDEAAEVIGWEFYDSLYPVRYYHLK